MKVSFLGVRGSTPAPGPDFVRYGGHTSCVTVSHDGDEVPTLALDAGTGIRSLTAMLSGASFSGSIVLSHLHWDHVQGIPFFGAGDKPDARVDVFVPAQEGRSGRDLVAQFLAPPAFPITPEGLRGQWSFTAIEPGEFVTDGFTVRAAEVQHKGGRTFGYRVSDGTSSIGYVPDHAPAAGVSDDLLECLHGVDVLIHDAQFVERERAVADDYGHATILDAIALADRVQARSLMLFHHGPHRTDEALDAIMDEIATSLPVSLAAEGHVLSLPA